ncbi:uncharacterized protein MONOS_9974 [Monocercomonoides exilis]|uniref:uncharacterized protein n=1 Tax=Monocercomonoides exilis TaxID=2049356 RepID=UPI00355944BD|nr:hypothetical protein MONOS_9974 [Monocercomonoides exilis]|eukprot:MONOS_9974.1-p1 / transcript=MONOS_9974.1 / gene=MONOS_9974 / organism=Monocercomonoides_exilis_PA203 / gene_product=unspecified product / transcript_product=unspecified product / location=Mono_scaffold00432:50725-51939(-) / protein_length=368 / sequence_SO=supercontig / SO=protein_coding / is_pseudo=false
MCLAAIACVCGCRYEADKGEAGSDECAEEWSEAEQGGVEKRKGDEVEGLVAIQRGSRGDTQEGNEMSRERITFDVSEGERDKNIQSEHWHLSSFLTTEERTQFLLLALKTLDAHLKKDHKIDSESPALSTSSPSSGASSPAIQPQSIPIRTKENEKSVTQQTSSSSLSSSSSSPVITSASSASTPPAIRPLALEGGKSPSTPNKLHLSSSEQIAFDPLDAINTVKEQAQKTETNRKEVSPKEQTGNLPIENVNETAIVQKRSLISDAMLPRSSSRHSFPVYPVPSQQQAAAKKKKAASMLSPKPQRLRREMWLGELIKEWLVYEDADQDAWNEMREAVQRRTRKCLSLKVTVMMKRKKKRRRKKVMN